MKKRFMILPPFLVIFTIYGALTDVSAATEGTTGTTETTLQEPILNEQPPGIPLPETVMEANDANIPETTTTESPPAEVTAVDEQMTETPAPPTEQPLPETADPQPTSETTTPATTPIAGGYHTGSNQPNHTYNGNTCTRNDRHQFEENPVD